MAVVSHAPSIKLRDAPCSDFSAASFASSAGFDFGIDQEGRVCQAHRSDRIAGCQGLGPGGDCSWSPRHANQFRLGGCRRLVVHRRRIEIEPADVSVENSSHRPIDLAVGLPDIQLGRQLDLAHQREHVLAVIHALDRRIVDVKDGIAIARQPLDDLLLPDDRLAVAGKHNLGLERENLVQRGDVVERPARLRASQRVNVRKRLVVIVSDKGRFVLRDPNAKMIVGLAGSAQELRTSCRPTRTRTCRPR